jgi:thiol-disulfide isomerase/thioredoxin
MRGCLLLLLLALPASLASWWWPEGPHYFDSPDVKEFPNPGDFDRAMRSSDPLLVQFFAPWCGHCTGFRPTYKQLGKQMHNKVRVAGIDCTVESNKDWCITTHKVPGYPTIRFYRHGGESLTNFIEYQGSRSLAVMTEWLENRLKVAIFPAKTATEVLPEAVRAMPGCTLSCVLHTPRDIDHVSVWYACVTQALPSAVLYHGQKGIPDVRKQIILKVAEESLGTSKFFQVCHQARVPHLLFLFIRNVTFFLCTRADLAVPSRCAH